MAITASFIYSAAKKVMLGRGSLSTEAFASISLTTSMKAMLVLESHTPDPTASVTTSLRSVFASRANSTNSAGVQTNSADLTLVNMEVSDSAGSSVVFFDADDGVFTSVSSGKSVGGILIYKWVGNDATSVPIALIDIGSPVTANGASINVNWDNGTNRIFALT